MPQTMAAAVAPPHFANRVEIRDMKLISAIPSRRFGALMLAALLAGCADDAANTPAPDGAGGYENEGVCLSGG
jgi:hypothetical protein